jgi:hypothetical protein
MATIGQTLDFVRWFDQIGIEDLPLVGGKNASLGEMVRELAATFSKSAASIEKSPTSWPISTLTI